MQALASIKKGAATKHVQTQKRAGLNAPNALLKKGRSLVGRSCKTQGGTLQKRPFDLAESGELWQAKGLTWGPISLIIVSDNECYQALITQGKGATMTDLPAIRGAEIARQEGRGAITRKGAAILGRPLGAQVAAALQAAARSEHSKRAYETGIGLFLQYLGGALGLPGDLATTGKEGRRSTWAFAGTCAILRKIEPGHLDGFRSWRAASGDSPNTLGLRAAAVVSFLSVAYRDGIITDKQALSMGIRPYRGRVKRDAKPTGRRLSREEAQALRAACDLGTNKGKRDLAILDLGLYAGLRVDEIASLDMADLRQDGGRWWVQFSGKGEKTRKVKVHDTLWASLTAWLQASGRDLGQGAGPVFAAINKGDVIGTPGIGTAAINRLVAEYGARAGLAPLQGQNRLSPHDLRRTAARNAYDGGCPLPLIQRMLGHSDVSTTMRYIGADDDTNGGAIDYIRY